MYDWANSAFWTTIVTAIFPPFFYNVAAQGLPGPVAIARFSWATTLAIAIVAVLAPTLGALADVAAAKKRFLGIFMTGGVLATSAMALIGTGDWLLAAALFIAGNIGVAGSISFYDSLLPHIARPEEIDRVSTAGFAVGFLGGGLLLSLNLLWYLQPAWFGIPDQVTAVRLSFVSVAIWWALFSLPLLLRVPEPERRLEAGEVPANPVRMAFARLGGTLRELRGYKQAFTLLVAFFLYNDGIQTIIRMATIYGEELKIPQAAMIGAIVLVQFIGIPFTVLFGLLAGRIGAKTSIFAAIAVYVVISVIGYFMSTVFHFYALAVLVGMVQGGSQALSRSLFARMIPAHKSSEYFGFFSVFEKFAGILGPAVFATTVTITGSTRNAVLSVVLFFVLGAIMLARVDVEEGERVARQASLKTFV
ncbi:MAG: MFS transporter [Acidobacteria bacterium]|nr:MFS transporter [Acidobacteriota bacterium]